MKNDYIVKKMYHSFVVTAILTSLTATVGFLIDNIVVGHYLGAEALGAMGIVGPISLFFSAIGNICSGGGATRAAQALGKGNQQDVNLIFSVNVFFVLGTGLAITLAGLLFAPQLALLLGAEGPLREPTVSYLYGYFLGTIPTIMLSAMMAFVRIDGSLKLPMVCMAVMTGVNILLDLLVVLVFHGGMFGMALSTTISYYCAVAVACTHFLKKSASLKLVRPRNFLTEMRKTAVTGMPTAISRISDTAKSIILNQLMVTFVSVSAVTTLNVRMQANNFICAIIIGMAQAASPIISMFFGLEDRRSVRDTLTAAIRLGLTVSFCLMAVFLLAPGFFPRLLGMTDPEILGMSRIAFRYFALGLPVAFLNSTLMNFYQCTKRVALSTTICLLQSFVYTVTLAAVLVRPMGSSGIWLAFLLGEVMTLLTTAVWIFVRNRKVSLSPDAILMFDREFGGRPQDRLDISIGNSMEEVATIASGIHKFARGRNMDEKMANLLSLTIEEMAGNVVKHSFAPGQKRWLDMTIFDKADRVSICFRDNGKPFDTVAYAAAHQEETGHLGIRLIHGLADEFSYRRVMNLNCLTISFAKNPETDSVPID